MSKPTSFTLKTAQLGRRWPSIGTLSALIFLLAFLTSFDAIAQSRFRNFTAETVGGRALRLAEGVVEFHRDKRYVWTPVKGNKAIGEWWLVGGMGQHSNIIRVKFKDGKNVDFHILEEKNELYLMRQDTGRYIDNRKYRIIAINPI